MVLNLLSNPGALFRDKNELHLLFRPPARGIYYVSLIGNWASGEDEKEEAAGVKRTNSLPIVKWKVDAQNYSASKGLCGKFPESNGDEYGPTKLAIRYGVRTSEINGIIRTNTGNYSKYN